MPSFYLAKLRKFVKRNYLIIGILIISLFFRLYNFSELYQYGHEQDLQGWIVKDILINKHLRLVGQETSITGLYIGPIYYYAEALSFWLTNMNPLSAIIPVTVLSILTTFSIYYVFKSLYSNKLGLIAAFLYSVGMGFVWLDRWTVPTVATPIWVIWFYYALISLLRKKIKAVYILVLLIGFIWYIHIAFVPLFILVPIAFWISKTKFKKFISKLGWKRFKNVLLIALILLVPFFAFEVRHGFQQTKGVLISTHSGGINGGEVRTGKYKLEIIMEYMDKVVHETVAYIKGWKSPVFDIWPYTIIGIFVAIYFLVKKKYFKKEEALLVLIWFVSTATIHYFSKRTLTEYYFNNLMIPTLVIASFLVLIIFEKIGTFVGFLLLAFLLYFNANQLLHAEAHGEYQDKLSVVNLIADDAMKHSYPCVGINFIGDYSTQFGYRYLFWYKGVTQVTPGNDVPVYSIVTPAKISGAEIDAKFSEIGVILPKKGVEVDPNICTDLGRQLQPLNGFTS